MSPFRCVPTLAPSSVECNFTLERFALDRGVQLLRGRKVLQRRAAHTALAFIALKLTETAALEQPFV